MRSFRETIYTGVFNMKLADRSKFLLLAILAVCLLGPTQLSAESTLKFKPIPIQFIAALGDPKANSGVGAEHWGLWDKDPGPRGVWLRLFPILKAAGGYGPAGWKFDDSL